MNYHTIECSFLKKTNTFQLVGEILILLWDNFQEKGFVKMPLSYRLFFKNEELNQLKHGFWLILSFAMFPGLEAEQSSWLGNDLK